MTLALDYDAVKNLNGYMVEVATTLGHGWTFKPSPYESTHNVGTLSNNDGLSLGVHRITYGSGKGRLTIRGCYDALDTMPDISRDMLMHLEYPHITVSPSRRADAVAADITRRLLPRYVPLFVKAMEDARRTSRYVTDGEETARRLAAVIGGKYSHDGKGTYTLRLFVESHKAGNVWGDITVYGTTVSVNIHNVTADMAEQVLRVVNGE